MSIFSSIPYNGTTFTGTMEKMLNKNININLKGYGNVCALVKIWLSETFDELPNKSLFFCNAGYIAAYKI